MPRLKPFLQSNRKHRGNRKRRKRGLLHELLTAGLIFRGYGAMPPSRPLNDPRNLKERNFSPKQRRLNSPERLWSARIVIVVVQPPRKMWMARITKAGWTGGP